MTITPAATDCTCGSGGGGGLPVADQNQLYGFERNLVGGGLPVAGGNLVITPGNFNTTTNWADTYSFDAGTNTIHILQDGIYSLNFGAQPYNTATDTILLNAAGSTFGSSPGDLTDYPLVAVHPGDNFVQYGYTLTLQAGETIAFQATHPDEIRYFAFRFLRIS